MFSNVKLFIRGTFGAFCPLWPTILITCEVELACTVYSHGEISAPVSFLTRSFFSVRIVRFFFVKQPKLLWKGHNYCCRGYAIVMSYIGINKATSLAAGMYYRENICCCGIWLWTIRGWFESGSLWNTTATYVLTFIIHAAEFKLCYLFAVLMRKYDNFVHQKFQLYPVYIVWIVGTL